VLPVEIIPQQPGFYLLSLAPCQVFELRFAPEIRSRSADAAKSSSSSIVVSTCQTASCETARFVAGRRPAARGASHTCALAPQLLHSMARVPRNGYSYNGFDPGAAGPVPRIGPRPGGSDWGFRIPPPKKVRGMGDGPGVLYNPQGRLVQGYDAAVERTPLSPFPPHLTDPHRRARHADGAIRTSLSSCRSACTSTARGSAYRWASPCRRS
jgi:hypothetical protein